MGRVREGRVCPSRRMERSGAKPREARHQKKQTRKQVLFAMEKDSRKKRGRDCPAWGERERGGYAPLAEWSEAEQNRAKRGTKKADAKASAFLVRVAGLEPARLSASDFKSDLSTNSTIPARRPRGLRIVRSRACACAAARELTHSVARPLRIETASPGFDSGKRETGDS